MDKSVEKPAAEVKPVCCIPPQQFKRNSHGLLEHVNYQFDENSLVNWRKMIPAKYLVFNKTKAEKIVAEYGKPLSELSVTDVDDKYLLILLAGLKELAQLRQYNSVHYSYSGNENEVHVVCEIEYEGNYETNNRPVRFESCATANRTTTTGIFQNYLLEIAENRALCRNIRNFLRIHILGQEESAAEIEEMPASNGGGNRSAISPIAILEGVLKAKGWSFDQLKTRLIAKSQREGATPEETEENKYWALAESRSRDD